MIPTLFAIMVVNFIIVQAAPGGPVEQVVRRFKGTGIGGEAPGTGGGGRPASGAAQPVTGASAGESRYRGARGLDPAFIKELEKQYGFDKPPLERFLMMMKNYLTFD